MLDGLSDKEKAAVIACEELYQKEEGKDWHVSGIVEKEETLSGFKLSLTLCKGDQCTMQDFEATAKDGKYEAKLDEEEGF
eukprot:CAMPEP_0170170440 /NCGR_PEP_ID=MMETSP0040_2-20121228/3432_1 /TAXON_ID=641309 /ORGANISM="Lotharella oceanica, Strain CCMP622" /LENGTH=79 /DNA_ID=CAMNT_0010409845 /DNA_START=39 /DNA_END=278 /DNA_ORIENTATION=+